MKHQTKNSKQMLFEMMGKVNPDFILNENVVDNNQKMSKEEVNKIIIDRGYVPATYSNNRGYFVIKVGGKVWNRAAVKYTIGAITTSPINSNKYQKPEGGYIKPEDVEYFKSLGFIEQKSGDYFIPGDDGKYLIYVISSDERDLPVQVGRKFSTSIGGWSRGGGWNNGQSISYEVIENLGNGKWKVRVTNSQHENYRVGDEEIWTEEQIKREKK